jgi:hypothetical protein
VLGDKWRSEHLRGRENGPVQHEEPDEAHLGIQLVYAIHEPVIDLHILEDRGEHPEARRIVQHANAHGGASESQWKVPVLGELEVGVARRFPDRFQNKVPEPLDRGCAGRFARWRGRLAHQPEGRNQDGPFALVERLVHEVPRVRDFKHPCQRAHGQSGCRVVRNRPVEVAEEVRRAFRLALRRRLCRRPGGSRPTDPPQRGHLARAQRVSLVEVVV